jgi:hypothetical protein
MITIRPDVCLQQGADLAPTGQLIESVGPARVPVCRCGGYVTVFCCGTRALLAKNQMGTKKSGKGRRKIGRKKRRNRAKIRHRKK